MIDVAEMPMCTIVAGNGCHSAVSGHDPESF